MDNIIDKKIFSNKKTIIYSCILGSIMFVIMGNLSLVSTLFKVNLTVNRIDLLKNGFSMSFFDICMLYISLSCLVYYILKNKEDILKNYIRTKVKSESILIKEIKNINKIISIAVALNLIIKTLIYLIFKGTLRGNFDIGLGEVFLSLLYMILIVFITYFLIIIGYTSIRDFIGSTFAYCCIFSSLSLVLGIESLFISNKIFIIENILKFIYRIYNVVIIPFYSFYLLYSLDVMNNIKTIFVLSIVSLVMVCTFKNCADSLNKRNIKEFYVNTGFRKLFYISIAIILGYCVFLVGFSLLISSSLVSYDFGLLIINLVQCIVSVLAYFKLNDIYLRKKGLKREKVKANKEKISKETLVEVKENTVDLENPNMPVKVYNKSCQNKYKRKNILGETLVFNKLTNIKGELMDCEIIKEFSFEDGLSLEINNSPINKKNINNKNQLICDEDIKNQVITCKDIDNEKLVDFLREDNTIEN